MLRREFLKTAAAGLLLVSGKLPGALATPPRRIIAVVRRFSQERGWDKKGREYWIYDLEIHFLCESTHREKMDFIRTHPVLGKILPATGYILIAQHYTVDVFGRNLSARIEMVENNG